MDSLDKSARDRPVLEKLRKPTEGVNDACLKAAHGGENGLSLKGLSFAEGYVKGVFHFILEYRDTALDEAAAVNRRYFFDLHYSSTRSGVSDFHAADERILPHWQDAFMLVGDVELMQIPKAVLPADKRLGFVQDMFHHGNAGAVPVFYMSVDGAAHPGSIFSDGQLSPVIDGVPVSFDENAVSVVKRSPEIMDCVTKDGWRVAMRFRELNASSLFEGALLLLGAETFSVVRDVSPEKRFKLVDVMIGPFYLQ
jgi:hypothetical protein